MDKDASKNLFKPVIFRKLREKHQRKFELEMCAKDNPFHSLSLFLYNKRDFFEVKQKHWMKMAAKGEQIMPTNINNYEELVALIPDDLGMAVAKNKSFVRQKSFNINNRAGSPVYADEEQKGTEHLLHSNLSDLHKNLNRSMSELEGFTIP